MLDVLYILLAGIIAAAIMLPVAGIYHKGKKEMEQTDENERK